MKGFEGWRFRAPRFLPCTGEIYWEDFEGVFAVRSNRARGFRWVRLAASRSTGRIRSCGWRLPQARRARKDERFGSRTWPAIVDPLSTIEGAQDRRGLGGRLLAGGCRGKAWRIDGRPRSFSGKLIEACREVRR